MEIKMVDGQISGFGVEAEEERDDEPWEAHGRFYEHAACLKARST